ncbi:MAG: alpha/beta hydrolase family protein [Candidatus Sumerlaeota bacterium]
MGRKDQLSVNAYFSRMGEKHQPEYRFDGNSKTDWEEWRNKLMPRVKATLGRMPEKVPLNVETICQWEQDGICKEKLIFDVEEGLSATAYLFRPADVSGKVPGILACHGHGPFGKDAIMGVVGDNPEIRTNIAAHNYDYGLAMAKAGYAVIAIDWRGFGERKDGRDNIIGSRDICNVHYIRASIMGMTVLGMNVHDGMCALDHLCAQDYVDSDKIGVMGLSFGGTMTTWMALCDDRIKAADIMGYSDRFASFGMDRCNFCGSQITPGLFALCDLPDLHGLLAPKPLLVEIGINDECFPVDMALSCYREVEKIYTAAELKDDLYLDLYESGHAWGGNKSVDFFNQYLRGE